MIHGIHRAVLSRLNSNGAGKTYFYRFNAQTELNFMKTFAHLSEDGAAHGDDIL
jgi:hypothetical protein